MAEATERALQNSKLTCLLINFSNSRFKECDFLPVLKNYDEENPIDLDCIDNKQALEDWLENELRLSRTEFDYSFDKKPTDRQTILRDEARFQRTSKLSPKGRRRIYLEIATNRYWYLDNFHKGKGSHLEVFSFQGEHIGEADLAGTINFSTKDRGKKLDY